MFFFFLRNLIAKRGLEIYVMKGRRLDASVLGCERWELHEGWDGELGGFAGHSQCTQQMWTLNCILESKLSRLDI